MLGIFRQAGEGWPGAEIDKTDGWTLEMEPASGRLHAGARRAAAAGARSLGEELWALHAGLGLGRQGLEDSAKTFSFESSALALLCFYDKELYINCFKKVAWQ